MLKPIINDQSKSVWESNPILSFDNLWAIQILRNNVRFSVWDPSIFWEEEAFVILSPRNCNAARGIFASLSTFLYGGFHANILRGLTSHHDVIHLTSVSPELVVVTPPVGVGAWHWLWAADLAVIKQLSSITKLCKYQNSKSSPDNTMHSLGQSLSEAELSSRSL